MTLYKQVPNEFPFGEAVAVDGWDDALQTAWQGILATGPEATRWLNDYLEQSGTQRANVSFGDTRRIVGRYGYGDFIVSYPAALLLDAVDPVAAMREAILTVLDRHVTKSSLGIPLLSSLMPRR